MPKLKDTAIMQATRAAHVEAKKFVDEHGARELARAARIPYSTLLRTLKKPARPSRDWAKIELAVTKARDMCR